MKDKSKLAVPGEDAPRSQSTPWVLTAIVFVVLCIGLAIYYEVAYKYHFFWHEQNQIFLLDREYVGHYFDKPAWLACLAGDYLTQFYYYLYAGPIILAMLVSATLWLLYSCLSETRLLAWAITIAMGVWIVGCTFSMFFSLSSLLCVTGGIVAYRVCRGLRSWGVILIPVIYWMFGFGVIVTAALYVYDYLSEALKNNRSNRLNRTKRENRLVDSGDFRGEDAPHYQSTLSVAAIGAFALALLTPLVLAKPYTLHYGQALLYPGIARPVMPESNFEANLGVENEYYFGNYDRAIKIAKDKANPDAISAFYYYLIKAKRDSLPDYLLDYGYRQLGTLQTIGETTPRPVINMMNDLYYALGDMTYAERAAMMRNVFSDQNRNVRMIKRLAEINLQSGDSLAAKKYLRILRKTHAYRGWASMYIDDNDNLTGNQAHHISGMSGPGRPTSQYNADNLRLGDNCRTILLQALEKDPDNTLALDYLLCTSLLLKEMDTFKADYDRYCMDRGRPRLRRLYQEALAIYLAGTNAPYEDWERYINPDTMRRFGEYNRHRGDRAFANTYWYYFDTNQ